MVSPFFPNTLIITDIPFPSAHLDQVPLNSPLSKRPQIPCRLLFLCVAPVIPAAPCKS